MAAVETTCGPTVSNTQIKLKLLTEDQAVSGRAARFLRQWGCCTLCVLRLLGETRSDIFMNPMQALRESLDSLEKHDNSDEDESLGTGVSCASAASDGVCVSCLGVLQDKFSSDDFLTKVAEKVELENHEFDDFFISISLPVNTLLREHALWLSLRQHFKEMYFGHSVESILVIKEVWKWANSTALGKKLGAPFSMKSVYDVALNFVHSAADRECCFLLDCFPNSFRQRKNNRNGWETFTRTNVSKAINNLSSDKFQKNYQSPPRPLSDPCDCDKISCTHEAIYLAGRYSKFCRELPQSPWILDGVRKADSSIQELICDRLKEAIKAADYRFSASGREDVDVRMLGEGRPFVVEFMNPRRVKLSQDTFAELQKEINESTKRIQIRDLQIVTREDTAALKEGEEAKVKHYRALCWNSKPVDDQVLNSLSKYKDLVLKQNTPIRVLHRRAIAVRERKIHSMKASKLDDHHFMLSLATQAGTYVKEFAHGDFGRTTPNLGKLLGVESDILELDVETAIRRNSHG